MAGLWHCCTFITGRGLRYLEAPRLHAPPKTSTCWACPRLQSQLRESSATAGWTNPAVWDANYFGHHPFMILGITHLWKPPNAEKSILIPCRIEKNSHFGPGVKQCLDAQHHCHGGFVWNWSTHLIRSSALRHHFPTFPSIFIAIWRYTPCSQRHPFVAFESTHFDHSLVKYEDPKCEFSLRRNPSDRTTIQGS